MAYFFGDGFDLYSSGNDFLNWWDNNSLNPSSIQLQAGRFTGGRSAYISNAQLIKVSGQNDGIHHINAAFTSSQNSASDGFSFTFVDGSTLQCSVVFNINGTVTLRSGNYNGTVLATYTGPVPAINTWHTFEVEVVIHNTNGSITVRRDGNPVNDFFLGSLNTRNSTNNYANKIQFICQNSVHWMDDFLWRSDAASVAWIGDVRCYTRMPVTDAQAQLTKSTTPANTLIFNPIGIGQNFTTANYLLFTSPKSGNLTAAAISLYSAATAHLKMAIFSNVGGAIGTVLATSNELTNPGAGSVTATFPSPVHLVGGQTYWIGFNQDAAIQYNVIGMSSTPITSLITLTQTYATWPVSNPGGSPTSGNIQGGLILTFVPATNADAVGEIQQDSAGSYVYSSTVGQNDLYAIGSITTTPVNIIGVVTRGFMQKSDAGTRNATVQLKSGTTTVQGTSTALAAGTWGWIGRTDLVDPATSAAWTATAVNNIQIGPVVTA